MACAACLGTGTVMFAAVNDVALCTVHAQGQPRPGADHSQKQTIAEEDAADALAVMNQRFYDGRQMQVEYSPVQNFQEVRGGVHPH